MRELHVAAEEDDDDGEDEEEEEEEVQEEEEEKKDSGGSCARLRMAGLVAPSRLRMRSTSAPPFSSSSSSALRLISRNVIQSDVGSERAGDRARGMVQLRNVRATLHHAVQEASQTGRLVAVSAREDASGHASERASTAPLREE